MDLPIPLKDLQAARASLNNALVPGLQVTGITPHSGNLPQRIQTAYTLTLDRDINDGEKARLQTFIDSDHYFVDKKRKGKTTSLDIRPLISHLALSATDTLQLEIVSATAQPGIKPIEALTAILDLDEKDSLKTRILKTAWQPL